MSRLPIGSLFFVGLAIVAWSELNAQASTAKATPASSGAKPIASQAASRADTSLFGIWRVSRGVIAPWVPVKEKNAWDAKAWVGQSITFDAKRVAGPSSLKCGDAHYEATSYPADALFQGGLTETVKTAAKNLGFAKFPVAGTSLNCDAGLYEFHKLDATAELVAVNNVIWTLDRSPGALAVATTPAGVVQRFLEAHFANDMGFDAARLASKKAFLTPSLVALTKKYFAKPVPKGDAPDIEGDPFTNSQDYPTRFSVGAPITTGTSSSVRVRFFDTSSANVVTYQLQLGGAMWRIDDVRYDAGPTFRELLGAAR